MVYPHMEEKEKYYFTEKNTPLRRLIDIIRAIDKMISIYSYEYGIYSKRLLSLEKVEDKENEDYKKAVEANKRLTNILASAIFELENGNKIFCDAKIEKDYDHDYIVDDEYRGLIYTVHNDYLKKIYEISDESEHEFISYIINGDLKAFNPEAYKHFEEVKKNL